MHLHCGNVVEMLQISYHLLYVTQPTPTILMMSSSDQFPKVKNV